MYSRSMTATFVLCAVLLAVGIAPAAPGPSQSVLWAEGGLFGRWQPADEVVELRTEHSKTFDNRDGTFSLLLSGPLHRLDSQGRWVDLDEAAVLANGGARGALLTGAESTRSIGNGPGIDNHIWGADVPYFRCQYLYLSTELMFNGWITALGFFGDGDGGGGDTINFARHWLKDTNYTSFASGAWDEPGNLAWGEGTLHIEERAGWVSQRLDEPVMHVHGKNLLVSYYHQDGTVERSQWYRFHSTGTTNRGKRGRSNSVNPPPQTVMTTRADILITYVPVFPDLQTVAILAPVDTVAHQAVVTPRATVRNNGPVPAISYSVRLNINGSYSNTQNKTELGIGGQTTISFGNWTASTLGDFAVACTTMLAGDTAPENNRATAAGFVRRLDAEALELVTPGAMVDSGERIVPQVRVRNNGNTTVTFPVLLTINGGYSNYAGAVNLGPGETRLLNFAEWTPPTRGSFTFTATTQLSGDQSSANNTVSRSVLVRVLDVAPVAITVPGAQVDSGQALLPAVTVRNRGNTTIQCELRVAISPDYSAAVTVSGLGPNESRSVALPQWLPVLRGPASVACTTSLAGDMVPDNDAIGGATFVAVRDVAVLSIEAPACSIPAGPIEARCRLMNHGNIRTPVAARFSVDAQPELFALIALNAGLPVGAETTVVFPELVIPVGDHVGLCSLYTAGDQVPDNNTLQTQFFAGSVDVAVVHILAPPTAVDTAAAVIPAVRVRNHGTVTALFDALFTIEQDGALEYESRRLALAADPGTELTVTFDEWTGERRPGRHLARCSVYATGDEQPANDTISRTVTVFIELAPHGWTELAPLPAGRTGRPAKDGAWLAYEASTAGIYAAKGNRTGDFFRYDPVSRGWLDRSPQPAGPENKPSGKGAAACSDNNGRIYAVKGNGTRAFWCYDVHADTWQQLADVPEGPSRARLKGGSDLAYVDHGDSQYVYLLKGRKSEFYRYNTATGEWQVLPDAPAGARPKWDKGSWLCADGSGRLFAHKAKYHELHTFDPIEGRWLEQTDGIPFASRQTGRSRKAKDGSDATLMGDAIYAFKGGNTQEFFNLRLPTREWVEKETIPAFGTTGKRKRVKAGGALASDGALIYALKGNATCEFWVYVPAAEGEAIRGGVQAREVPAQATLAVGPNPARAAAAVRWSGLLPAHSPLLTLYDASGRVVLTRTLDRSTAGTLTLDVSSLPAGVYLLRAGAPGIGPSQKLVISR